MLSLFLLVTAPASLAATTTTVVTSPTRAPEATTSTLAGATASEAVDASPAVPESADGAALPTAVEPAWALSAGLSARIPARLGTGLLLGPEATVGELRPLGDVLTLAGRVGVALGAEDDLTWHVHHTELWLLARARAQLVLGRGRVAVALSAGLVALHEVRTRHQADRLVEAGQDTRTAAWSAGPAGTLEAELELDVIEGWGLLLAGGPSLAGLRGADTSAVWGWGARLGVVLRL